MNEPILLLANDDGIQAEGIHVLHDAVRDLAQTHVVAPDGERSAIAQAITLGRPLYTAPWPPPPAAPFGTAISGTPADCVKIGATTLLPAPPTLVLSGINLGPNTGISVLYSGTCAVASEALVMGIPAVAFSLSTFEAPVWPTARRVARSIVAAVLSGALPVPPDTFLNVNIPNLPFDELRGLRVTTMGASRFVETYTPATDPSGRPCYTMAGDLHELDSDPKTDIRAVRAGYVSLSPIALDRTHHPALSPLRALSIPL